MMKLSEWKEKNYNNTICNFIGLPDTTEVWATPKIDKDGNIIGFAGCKEGDNYPEVEPIFPISSDGAYLFRFDGENIIPNNAADLAVKYKDFVIPTAKKKIYEQLYCRVELPKASGFWFNFSDKLIEEIPKAITLIQENILDVGVFYYFDSETSQIEIYKEDFTLTELKSIYAGGIAHYNEQINKRKKIVSEIQNAETKTEIDNILSTYNLSI